MGIDVGVTTREISPGVHAVQACNPQTGDPEQLIRENPDWYEQGHDVHVPRTAYLLLGDETLLYDPLSPADTDLVNPAYDEILDGRGLDYVVVSHPDAPHAGNTGAVLGDHPEATLVAPGQGGRHELYRLEDSIKMHHGDVLELGGFSVKFHEAVFLDAALSIWLYEEREDILFTADWMGFPHLDTDCLKFVDELERELSVHQLVQLHARVFHWYRFSDVDRISAEIDYIIDMDPSLIAPAHGLPFRSDIEGYLEQMKAVVEHIRSHGRLKAFGAK